MNNYAHFLGLKVTQPNTKAPKYKPLIRTREPIVNSNPALNSAKVSLIGAQVGVGGCRIWAVEGVGLTTVASGPGVLSYLTAASSLVIQLNTIIRHCFLALIRYRSLYG